MNTMLHLRLTRLLLAGAAGSIALAITNPLHALPQAWETPALTTLPPARSNHASTVEFQTERILVFGGTDSAGQLLGDTWSYDAFRWTLHPQTTGPTARTGSAMALDGMLGLTMLFGGSDALGPQQDLWLYTGGGNTWVSFPQPGPPPARFEHAMANDPVSRHLVVFGGNGGATTLGDTWVLDTGFGTGWTQLPIVGPQARQGHTMVSLPGQGVLLFGGLANGVPVRDMWLLTVTQATSTTPPSGTWTQLFYSGGPLGGSVNHAMAVDPGLGPDRALMLRNGGGVLQQWLVDVTPGLVPSLTMSGFPQVPLPRTGHSLERGAQGRLVVFGGNLGGGVMTSETRTLQTTPLPSNAPIPATVDVTALGCGSGNIPTLTSDTGPLLGSNFTVDMGGFHPATTPFVLFSLGFSRQPQSCFTPTLGHVSANTILLGLSPIGGLAQHTIPIPNSAALAGTLFFGQAIGLDGSGNPPFRISNQIFFVLG